MMASQHIANTRFENWIFRSFPMNAEQLGLYRIAYSLYLLIWGIPNFSWIHNLPDSFFNPPAYSIVGLLFSSFPPYWFMQGMSLLIVTLAILLLFGYQTRWVSVLLGLSIIFCKGFAFSFGLIGQDIIVWLVPILLSFSNWGAAFSIDAQRSSTPAKPVHNWPVTMVALLLGFAMFTAGLPKLLGGWLDPATQATRGHFFTQYHVIGDLTLLAHWMRANTNIVLWEVMDWGAVLFEMGFLVAVLNPRWFRWIIGLAVIFHASTFLVFNISFHFQYSVYLLFICWGTIPGAFFKRMRQLSLKLFTPIGLIAVLVAYVPFYVLSQQTISMPGLLAPSPFLMLTELLGMDYKIVVGVTALIPAIAILAWQLTVKRNS